MACLELFITGESGKANYSSTPRDKITGTENFLGQERLPKAAVCCLYRFWVVVFLLPNLEL